MCGIVAYVGPQDAYPILIEGLKRLEYRGYDSAGVALLNEADELNVYKAKGKVSDLVAFAYTGDGYMLTDPELECVYRNRDVSIYKLKETF